MTDNQLRYLKVLGNQLKSGIIKKKKYEKLIKEFRKKTK